MIRKCQLLNKMVELKKDCATCQLKDSCKNPGGPDMNKDRPHFQVIVK